ncbi:uncharacterized protein LOC126575682 [Anopheles aquasalis]|uniref:uncharacterized protein LOC126575682 n=1 Tax=Anopheles aquasalis TaxID=42839 RepID=UPI00215A89B3|nr:uncharacterized protein LOC126575682 [Anopheles aquasalis]
MERYLRFYIKFQGYMIGMITLLFSVIVTFFIHKESQSYTYPMEYYYNFRFMGHTPLVLGIIWFVVAVAFIYGVYTESKQLLFPYALMYLIDLFLIAIRDVIMIWHEQRWYSMVFTNFPAAVAVLYVSCYLMMTLIALSRLFSSDPKSLQGTNFARFSNGISNPIALGDEAVLVEA